MGIRYICPSCDNKLNVKSYLAGKRGICPKCDARIRIPFESEDENQPAEYAGDKPRMIKTVGESIAERPELKWFVRPADGGEFGPASGETLKVWVHEKRIDHRTELRRHDWINWRQAGELFSEFQQHPNLADSVTSTNTSTNLQPQLQTEQQQDNSVAVLEHPIQSLGNLESAHPTFHDDNFFEALETSPVGIESTATFANLQVDQSTLAHHNIRRSDATGNRMKGIVLAFLSVVLLGSLVAVVVLSQ